LKPSKLPLTSLEELFAWCKEFFPPSPLLFPSFKELLASSKESLASSVPLLGGIASIEWSADAAILLQLACDLRFIRLDINLRLAIVRIPSGDSLRTKCAGPSAVGET
jgi:hypothetical protein